MFIKIAWHVEEEGITPLSGIREGLVVPRQHCMFETKRAEYRKIRVRSVGDFEKWLMADRCGHEFIGPGMPEEALENHGVEFLFVRIYDDEDTKESNWKNFVAPNSYLYVMNDQGKTIDTLICH